MYDIIRQSMCCGILSGFFFTFVKAVDSVSCSNPEDPVTSFMYTVYGLIVKR